MEQIPNCRIVLEGGTGQIEEQKAKCIASILCTAVMMENQHKQPEDLC